MSNRKMHNDVYPKFYSNWDKLTDKTKAIVRDVMENVADDRNGPEGYKSSDDCFEDIEYLSRDGFAAFDHNRGGLTYLNFTQISDYECGGYVPAHKQAASEIERQLDHNHELVRETVYDDNEALCLKLGITKDDLSYHAIDEYLEKSDLLDAETKEQVKKLLRDFEDTESSYMNDSENSVMHELRFMYHGHDESGLHTASVSAAVNTEGPYHRSSISWSPKTFCEGSKEIEITWKNDAELKRKLDKAFKKVSKEIF